MKTYIYWAWETGFFGQGDGDGDNTDFKSKSKIVVDSNVLLWSSKQPALAGNISQHGLIRTLIRVIQNAEWKGDIGDSLGVDMNISKFASSN